MHRIYTCILCIYYKHTSESHTPTKYENISKIYIHKYITYIHIHSFMHVHTYYHIHIYIYTYIKFIHTYYKNTSMHIESCTLTYAYMPAHTYITYVRTYSTYHHIYRSYGVIQYTYTHIGYMHTYYVYIANRHPYMSYTHTKHKNSLKL